MTDAFVIDMFREMMLTTLLIAGPILLLALAVGLMISIFQAVTQIQEMTLTFIPKILAVLAAGWIFLPWIIRVITAFALQVFTEIERLSG